MTIFVKNKHTLQLGEFKFKCSIGKKGSTINKKEGDKKTPKGIFEIENLTDDVKEAYLLVECPRQLFPFARRIIYDLHADGALPPLMLDPVNFAELYKKKTSNN